MTHAALFFTDRGDHWACRWLRRGFRHVELAVLHDGVWIGVSGKTGALLEVMALPIGFNPESFAFLNGLRLLWVRVDPRPRRSPVGLQTCVGLAKAMLGVRAPWVITPWQLYRRLS